VSCSISRREVLWGVPFALPIGQPTRVEMVINRRTAALLRLTIPPALLLQAERVIDGRRRADVPRWTR